MWEIQQGTQAGEQKFLMCLSLATNMPYATSVPENVTIARPAE